MQIRLDTGAWGARSLEDTRRRLGEGTSYREEIGPTPVGRGDDAEAADWRRRWRQPRETGKECRTSAFEKVRRPARVGRGRGLPAGSVRVEAAAAAIAGYDCHGPRPP
jgi:hypothetical protein